MTPDDYSADFAFDLNAADLLKARSRQQDDGVIGASDFGCREQMRRTLTQTPKTDSPPMLPALIGSWIDAGAKQARALANPKLLLDQELPFAMPCGFTIMVHPDEIDQDEPSVTDYKTRVGLAAIRRGFTDDRYRRQRHLQYAAAHQNGLVPPDGITRNVFIDRSGKDPDLHVEQEPFSPQLLAEADEFLTDVLYAVEHDEEASKDVPRHVCEVSCPWFTDCRGNEIETPEITDPRLVERAAAYYEAKQAKEAAEALMSALRPDLDGLTGQSKTHRVVTTAVNPVDKRPYTRLTIEAL